MRARWAVTAASLALALSLTVPAAPLAGQARVRTTVDTTLVTVGDRITMTVAVDHPVGTSVAWPDSVDLAPFEILDARLAADEAVPQGVRSTLNLALTVFELGDVEIPSFDLSVVGPDGGIEVLSTDRFGVEVVSVGADETGDIREIRGPLLIPLSAVWLLALLLLLVILFVSAWALYRRYRRNRPVEEVAPGPPPPPAHEVALQALERLEKSSMLERGEVKEFHIEASEIVRRYVEARFSVHALEMTTWEVVDGLERTGVDAETREALRGFLDRCDLVKFAKVRPSSDDALATLGKGRELVERTVAYMAGAA